MTVEVIKSKEQPLAEGILLGTWIPNDVNGREVMEKQRAKGIPLRRASKASSVRAGLRDGRLTRGPNAPLPRDFGSSLREKLQSDFNSEGIFDVKPMVLRKDDRVKLPQ